MFHTVPEAELTLLSKIAPNDQKIWLWIEFGLHLPYYLVVIKDSYEEEGDKIELVRQLLLSKVEQILDLADQEDETSQILNLSVLSPGYMNESGEYQLDQVKEIWENNEGERRFILSNGGGLCYPKNCSGKNMKLIFKL